MTKIVNSLEELGKEIADVKTQVGIISHRIELIWYFLTSPRIEQVIDMNQFELKKDSELAKTMDLEKAKKERMQQLKKE